MAPRILTSTDRPASPPDRIPGLARRVDDLIRNFQRCVRQMDGGDLHRLDENYDRLDHLRQYSWYPVGIPPEQMDAREPFTATEDALHLVDTLLKADEPVLLVVANSPTNLFAERGDQAFDEAELIGRRQQAFYEALQSYVLKEKAAPSQTRIPVVLSSELTAFSHFVELFEKVARLFETDDNFYEAVLSCVPKRFEGDLCKRLPYVFYQIATTLFFRGKKLGHQKEAPYDAATGLAHSLLQLSTPVPTFSTLTLPDARGEIPYRAVRGASPIPDALDNYRSALLEASTAVSESDPEGLAGAVSHWGATMDSIFERLGRIQQIDELTRQRLLQNQWRFPPSRCRDVLINAHLHHSARGILQGLAHPSFPVARFLLQWTGLASALEADAKWIAPPSEGTFIPFEVAPFEESARSLGGGYRLPPPFYKDYLVGVVKGLLSPVDDFSPGVFRYLSNPFPLLRHDLTRWRVPFQDFETAIFTPLPALETPLAPLLAIPTSTWHQHRRWSSLDALLRSIRGTPLEPVYHAWLAELCGQTGPTLERPPSSNELTTVAIQRIKSCLGFPQFQDEFRQRFLTELQSITR